MKKALFLLSLLGLTGAARADVAWEHRGSIQIGTQPLVSMTMKNQWSGQKHRLNLALDLSKAMQQFAPSNTKPITSEVQIIERLDTDRLIFSATQNKTFVDEPLSTLKSRLRLNFWPAFGSDLPSDDIPQLTPEQRQRLGREMRAVISPVMRKYTRTFFRELPERRTIMGLPSRGYRFTSKVNVSGSKTSQEWVSVAAEWWMAETQSGDDEIRTFTQNANQIRMAGGGASASMWLNEMYPVLWEAAPEEAHQALESFLGTMGSSNFGFQGTPMQFYVTVSGPPAMQMGMGGALRLSLELSKRDTTEANAALFEVPTGYQKIAIEPFIGMAQNFINMSRGQIEKLLDE